MAQALGQADALLYEAKRAGRNRVRSASAAAALVERDDRVG
jgi:PleD family two-component response regulator